MRVEIFIASIKKNLQKAMQYDKNKSFAEKTACQNKSNKNLLQPQKHR